MTLDALNAAAEADAAASLARCCGARAWVERMVAARPFASRGAVHEAAARAWAACGHADALEVFARHPRIGEGAGARAPLAATAAWARGEQSGAASADAATRDALASGQRAYERRFGHRFIVCASGLSAGEMLSRLEARLANPPDVEWRVAAGEQARITRLRLDKLLDES